MNFKIKLILFTYLISLFFALLEPFDFDFDFDFSRENNAEWLQTKNGIRFEQKGQIISSSSTPGLYQILAEGDGLTLEVWISTYNTLQDGPARILSYSLDPSLRNFTLAQSKDKLVMRLRTELTNLNGTVPHVEVADIFEVNKIYHIVITYNFDNECVFLNGKKLVCDDKIKGKFSNWDPSFKLVIGNEANGDRPWLGEIYYAAIYSEALSIREVKLKYEAGSPNANCLSENQITNGTIPVACYLFSEKEGKKIEDTGLNPFKFNLHIPDKRPANMPFSNLRHLRNLQNNFFTFDNLLNILGFIPLGFLLHRLIRLKFKFGFQIIPIVLIIGLSISLGCEVLQHFLPSRHSSLIDVFTNMFGLILGITVDKLVL